MRRGRDAAADEGGDVTAPAPEWSAAAWTEKMGVPDSRRIVVPETVRMKIELIELEARRLGWLPELLWNADFWRLPRGLAPVLDEDDEIGAVTAEYIEMMKTKHHLLRFQRRNS